MTSAAKPRVLVVVVTHNCLSDVDPCLGSVFRWMPYASVAVIDNASKDGTAEKLRGYGDRIRLFEPGENLGFPRANNVVLRSVPADFYLLLNPDAYLTSDLFAEIVAAYDGDTEAIDIAGPLISNPDGSYQTSAYSFTTPVKWLLQMAPPVMALRNLTAAAGGRVPALVLRALGALPVTGPFARGILARSGGTPRREPVDWVTGACMVMSRRVIEATNGFDDAFFIYCDDEEICYRAHRMGFKVERVHTSPVVHRLGWNANRRNHLSAPMYRSMEYMIRKNNADRPLRRWMLLRILSWKHRRAGKVAAGG